MKDLKEIWKIVEEVSDPEIPVLSVTDMGVIRNIELEGNKTIVTITPTYSGCPAMNEIEENIRVKLIESGIEDIEIKTSISPPWTTDWLTERGKRKLKEYGIAPPEGSSQDKRALFQDAKKVQCPLCDSRDTEMLSQFGSTACKSLYKCVNCKEPFDYFKCF